MTMLRRRLPLFTALAAACFAVCADSARAQSDSRERIRREVLEKRRQMREGNIVRANVRVTVRLNNGSRLKGVVKDGRFIERPDRVAFVATDVKSESSGLRVWYSNNTNSYIFLPYHSIKRYRIGEKLTDQEVEEIARRIDESRREAEKQRAERLAQRRGPGTLDEGEEGEGVDIAQTPAKPESEQFHSKLTPAQQQLLSEFPPEQGWGLEKLQTLERRKVTIGVFPNEREAKFIENFSEWTTANQMRRAEEEEAAAARQAAEEARRANPDSAGSTVPTQELPSKTPTKQLPRRPASRPQVPQLPKLPSPYRGTGS